MGHTRSAGRKSRLTQVSCVGEHGRAPLQAIDKTGFVGAQPCAPTGLNQNQVGFCDTLAALSRDYA